MIFYYIRLSKDIEIRKFDFLANCTQFLFTAIGPVNIMLQLK